MNSLGRFCNYNFLFKGFYKIVLDKNNDSFIISVVERGIKK